MTYNIEKRILHFKQPAGTSRGVYTERKIWLIHLSDGDRESIGECAPLPDLSCDALSDEKYESIDRKIENSLYANHRVLEASPNYAELDGYIRGKELHSIMLVHGASLNRFPLKEYDTAFSRGEEGIPINGLVWMGRYDEMIQRMEEKLEKGFRCVKLKIGAIDFEQELDLVKRIRNRFSFHEVELRLDANGAFKYEEALYKLELLSQYAVHSIEQPIRQGQWAYMAELCRESPLPIALDEELIGVNDPEMKGHMLNIIKPRYIILKPSLHGGMKGCREWIQTAKECGIGSWITSALESNIGLNAIAQFASDVYGPHIRMPQGLGTGQLFTDNIPMPLVLRGDMLFFDKEHKNRCL